MSWVSNPGVCLRAIFHRTITQAFLDDLVFPLNAILCIPSERVFPVSPSRSTLRPSQACPVPGEAVPGSFEPRLPGESGQWGWRPGGQRAQPSLPLLSPCCSDSAAFPCQAFLSSRQALVWAVVLWVPLMLLLPAPLHTSAWSLAAHHC